MLPAERQQRIVAALAQAGVVRTDDLVRVLEVSDETVRRDLQVLERRGLLTRVHGGATPPATPLGSEPPFQDRSAFAADAKSAIGGLAAGLVEPDMTIMIDVGTTALEVARALPDDHRGVVATCSLVAAMELADRPGVQVVVSGGRLRFGDLALSNHLTVGFFADLRPDLAFIGSGGLDETAGLTDFHLDEVATRRVVLANAVRSYVLADASKFGKVAPHRVCGLSGFTGVITDQAPPPALAAALRKAQCQVKVAGAGAAA